MSDQMSTAEQALQRSIVRRRRVRVFLLVVPMLAAVELSSRWIAARWALPVLAVRSVLLLLLALLFQVGPAKLVNGLGDDARETPRLRWAIQERSERILERLRPFMVAATGLLLLCKCAVLAGFVPPEGWQLDADAALMTVILIPSGLFRRRGDPDGREAAHRDRVALGRALLVASLAAAAAILIGTARAALLRPALEAALLAGALTLQLGLMRGVRQTQPIDAR